MSGRKKTEACWGSRTGLVSLPRLPQRTETSRDRLEPASTPGVARWIWAGSPQHWGVLVARWVSCMHLQKKTWCYSKDTLIRTLSSGFIRVKQGTSTFERAARRKELLVVLGMVHFMCRVDWVTAAWVFGWT